MHALVVDDEPAICRCFETLLSQLNCTVSVAASAEAGLTIAERTPLNLILLDVRLPGMDGLDALSRFRECSAAPIIVMTAHGDLSTAVTAVEKGAFEYIPKPFDLHHVSSVIERALNENQRRPNPDSARSSSGEATLVGNSRVMQDLFRRIALAAQHDAPVLITGESGTGKELVAHAIHHHSRRASEAIVPVHLASVSEGLIERELFGHAAGAYTGAQTAQKGLVQRAAGGTLFLDEIGEASPAVQVKLLRTMETQEFYRVGSSVAEHSDFRLIAATNRPVDELRMSASFRTDFFHRLSAVHIQVPPLRERVEDIPLLAEHFLHLADGAPHRLFSKEAIQCLQAHSFTGNVRELRNIVISAASQTRGTVVGLDVIQDVFRSFAGSKAGSADSRDLRETVAAWAARQLQQNKDNLLETAVTLIEEELIQAALEQTEGNRTAAAARLGIHRETLREKLQKLKQRRGHE